MEEIPESKEKTVYPFDKGTGLLSTKTLLSSTKADITRFSYVLTLGPSGCQSWLQPLSTPSWSDLLSLK